VTRQPLVVVIPQLAPVAGDVVVQKTTSGPLAGTDIAARLAIPTFAAITGTDDVLAAATVMAVTEPRTAQ
jgi:hypothetical protein